MNLLNKILIGFALISNICIYTMEQPAAFDKNDRELLNKFLTSLSYKNPLFISSRSDADLQKIIIISYDALSNPKELANLSEYVRNFSKKFDITIILNEIINVSTRELQKRKLEVPQRKPGPMPQQIMPEAVKAPVAIAKQPEEEIRPNKLYINLDIKDLNTNGQRIRWETPIHGMASRVGNEAEFEPNDYFHITLAWIETKNAFDPVVVAKFERALARAAEILKIVFPNGVNASLLDGAVPLGQNAVVFRVGESADFKKMQDIFLKFLSFENIEGIRFNTFNRENPLHITLGKIWPVKIAQQFRNSLSSLSAPDGARASQGQSFTVNTFRLTYTIGGQAWQEKMSYKF